MEHKSLISDEEAMTPVIGVILMVAVTVILAAVIASFVLGIGSSVDTVPQASFSFEFNDAGDGDFDATVDGDTVTITHRGGGAIDVGRLTLVVDDTRITPDEWSGEISTGAVESISDADVTMESDDVIRIVWTSDTSKQTATLDSATIP